MPATRSEVLLIRHGETEWSLSGRHTGTTDIPLTQHGRDEARRLRSLLAGSEYALVLSSPLDRARATCELAGLAHRMQLDSDLGEWNYGEYEGLTPEEIERRTPGWTIFTDGCPGGESPEQIGARVDRLICKVRTHTGRVALFAHGHIFRVFAARWIGLPPSEGRHFMLDTSTISVLSYYHGVPAVKRWNAEITLRR